MRIFPMAIAVMAWGMAQSDTVYPVKDVVQFVVDRLDVTSFPSSIGPRREKNKTSFKDYGFTKREIKGNEVVLEEEGGGWKFTVAVLKRSDQGILVCIADRAVNGGSYNTQGPLFLVRKDGKSLLRWDGREAPEVKECPKYPY